MLWPADRPNGTDRPRAQAERTARRHAILKMTYGDMSPMLVKETPFYHLPAGSLTGALNRHQWREQIKRAKQQAKNAGNDDDGGGFGGGGANRQVAPEMIKLVEKKIPLRTEAYSAEQMRDMIALAKELDYERSWTACTKAGLFPATLGRQGADRPHAAGPPATQSRQRRDLGQFDRNIGVL